ncbi:hypothetical protein BDV25DRAFT_143407 [Aspergillus avenaceus]|uniref:Cyanovirin-N domain-containing protein n=1 Tax=Aspergillus avenaceus TaxID=36643 RepID=A0A5N6TK80_ASPAV|nr:hypothetical protein BDV25DRAFT_143407 [Aspergillus avenaceus]
MQRILKIALITLATITVANADFFSACMGHFKLTNPLYMLEATCRNNAGHNITSELDLSLCWAEKRKDTSGGFQCWKCKALNGTAISAEIGESGPDDTIPNELVCTCTSKGDTGGGAEELKDNVIAEDGLLKCWEHTGKII